MKAVWIAALVFSSPAFGCVEGSYAVVESRLRVCAEHADGTSAYDTDPSNAILGNYVDQSRGERQIMADFKAVSGMTNAKANAFWSKEQSQQHYRSKLTADTPEKLPILERFAQGLNENFGYDGMMVYQAGLEKAARERKTLPRPLADLDRFAERNHFGLDEVSKKCDRQPKAAGDLRAVEMVFPATNVRQTVLPIAVTFEDGAKNHGKVFYVGRAGVTSRVIVRKNNKMYLIEPNKREVEVTFNEAPVDEVAAPRSPAVAIGGACAVAGLARRGEVREAAAAIPAPRTKKAEAAQ